MKLKSRVEFLNESSFDDLFGAVHQGNLDYSSKGLKSLVDLDIPDTVTGDFYCNLNHLTSLQGAPTTVGGGFYCYSNQLTSLEGAPTTVNRDFSCSSNPKLSSLEGAPTTVGGNFYCDSNPKLTSLKGHPKEVKGNFNLIYCPLITAEMIEDLKKNCKIGGKIITK